MIPETYTQTIASQLSPRVAVVRHDREVVLRDGTTGISMRWGVTVGGFVHGGTHVNIEDANAHARGCDAWTPEQFAEWVERHDALGVQREAA